MVASAAATQTGFPPKVVPCSRLPGVHDAGAGDECAQGMPLRCLWRCTEFWFDAGVFEPTLTGAAHADWTSSNEEDAVLAADALQFLQEEFGAVT